MDELIKKENNILPFTLFKVEKGREKICKCYPPHYELDPENRIVSCADCGATIDPFDTLICAFNFTESYREYQERAIENFKMYKELADKEWRRRFKNAAFKDMDRQYHDGMLPHCPRCGEVFDPMEIRQWTNRKYCDMAERAESEVMDDCE